MKYKAFHFPSPTSELSIKGEVGVSVAANERQRYGGRDVEAADADLI